MMSKIGRNDPCPCGSGKKYKKCCLPKEQQRSVAGRRKDDTDDFFEDLPAEPAALRDENEAMGANTQSEPELENELVVYRTISDEVPEIGEEQSALVDVWWTAYKGMKDPDKIIRHLDDFFQTHPDLVTNLELHHEVLFELGAQLVKAGRASDYIELLQRVRRDFPDAYLKSFGYYDLDIIHYKIASQDSEGIEDYLNWFGQYPDHDPDNLFGLIDFLMATECDQPLIDLLEVTYYPVCRSKKIIGGGEILAPLILSYYAPYLDRGWTRADLDVLSEQLKAIRIPLRDQLYRPEYLDSLFEEILGDLDAAFFATFYDIRDIHEYYRTVTHNFMGWLRKEKQFSWMKAQFYQNQVNRYLVYVIPDGKRPKRPFVFSRKLLDDTISRMARKIFSLDATKTLGALNAIYWFAEYLLRHQAISEQECANVQNWCEELWRIAIPQFLGSTIEARAFDTFPR
jgi:tetratricopeptide (TPR) repeat protein